MKRRNFLQYLSSSFILPVSIDGYGAKAFAQHSPFVQALMGLAGTTDKVLVIIQMQGGNDGLNMVIPLDQMSTYNSLRNSSAVSNIAIPENKAFIRTLNFVKCKEIAYHCLSLPTAIEVREYLKNQFN